MLSEYLDMQVFGLAFLYHCLQPPVSDMIFVKMFTLADFGPNIFYSKRHLHLRTKQGKICLRQVHIDQGGQNVKMSAQAIQGASSENS